MNDNTIKLKLPGRNELIQITWSSDIEIISRRVEVAPLYSYRWEVDGDERTGREAIATDTTGGNA